jgi:hypothetical protein
VIAAEYGISPTTVQRIKKSDSVYDKPRNPDGYPELGNLEETIFFEMIRLSRFHYLKLIEYLAPTWSALPSLARQQGGQNGAVINVVSGKLEKRYIEPSTFFRHLQRYVSGELLRAYDKTEPEPGSVAIHQIRIFWKDKNGTESKREVLLLMDRGTGLLYANSYQRVRKREVAIGVARFEYLFGDDIKSLHLVTATRHRENLSDDPSYTSVLNLGPIKVSGDQLTDDLKDVIEDELTFDFPVYTDQHTPFQERRVTIPGTYADQHELNRTITNLVNAINLTPRNYYRNSRVEMTPFKKLIKHHQRRGKSVSEKQTRQRIESRKGWKYEYDYGSTDEN